MVKRGNSSILPRFTQQSSNNESFISQSFRLSKKAYLLDKVSLENIKPSLLFYLLTIAIFSLQCYLMALSAHFIKSGTVINPINLLFCIIALSLFSILSSLCYKSILKRSLDVSLVCYCMVSLYSMVYLPVSIFLNVLVPLFSFIFLIGVAMISQFFLSNCLLMDYQFGSGKQQFLFYLSAFIFQYGGIMLISYSVGAL